MKITLFLLVFVVNTVFAQVTKVGNDTLIDIATWNTEWFGDTENGPTDENLQYANIKNIIQKTDIDVWALCEVSASNILPSLLTDLSAYVGEISSYSQTQKTALVWKKNKLALISANSVSDATEPNFNYAFVNRPPLEVVLKTINSGTFTDTIYFYVLHLKANSGSADQESYNRRKDASTYLKKYLSNPLRKNRKVVILGDFNDDMDMSVVKINSNNLITPFANFVNDTTNYFSPSLRLSLLGKSSYPNFNPPNMIDHILNSRTLSDSFYVQNSAVVLSQLGTQVAGYLNNTTDHYPVMAQYNFKRYPKVDTTHSFVSKIDLNNNISIYPNPTNGALYINTSLHSKGTYQISVYNNIGELVFSESTSDTVVELPSNLSNGVYFVTISKAQYRTRQKIVLLR